jgi:hypothetical protein
MNGESWLVNSKYLQQYQFLAKFLEKYFIQDYSSVLPLLVLPHPPPFKKY